MKLQTFQKEFTITIVLIQEVSFGEVTILIAYIGEKCYS